MTIDELEAESHAVRQAIHDLELLIETYKEWLRKNDREIGLQLDAMGQGQRALENGGC